MKTLSTVNRITALLGTAIVTCALTLGACILPGGGDSSGRTIFATKWIKADTLLAYGIYEWKEGRKVSEPGEDPESSGSLIRVYTVDVTQACSERNQIRVVGNAVPCYDLDYRAEDSLLYLSYLPLGKATKGLAANCDWVRDSIPRRLEVGKAVASAWSPGSASLDTVTLLSMLSHTVSDVAISPYGGICPPGCGCFSE